MGNKALLKIFFRDGAWELKAEKSIALTDAEKLCFADGSADLARSEAQQGPFMQWFYQKDILGQWQLMHPVLFPQGLAVPQQWVASQNPHFLQKFLQKKIKLFSQVLFIDATGGFLQDSRRIFFPPATTEQVAQSHRFQHVVFEAQKLLAPFIRLSLLDHPGSQLAPATSVIDFYPEVFTAEALMKLAEKFSHYCRILYYDPMFEYSEQKSLPKKEMQILRSLPSALPPSWKLEQEWQTWKKYCSWIIVKRTLKAPYLQGEKPTYSVATKLTRWDVYYQQNCI